MSIAEKMLRRADVRNQVVPTEVKGLMSFGSRQGNVPFLIWDVSDSGLRLWLTDKVSHGEMVQLTIAKPQVMVIEGEVRWCRKSDDGEGYHVGIQVTGSGNRLESLTRMLNQIKIEEP